jgi:hypothetical protein
VVAIVKRLVDVDYYICSGGFLSQWGVGVDHSRSELVPTARLLPGLK